VENEQIVNFEELGKADYLAEFFPTAARYQPPPSGLDPEQQYQAWLASERAHFQENNPDYLESIDKLYEQLDQAALLNGEDIENVREVRGEAWDKASREQWAEVRRFVGLSEEQQFAEFTAWKEGADRHAEVRAAHDAMEAPGVVNDDGALPADGIEERDEVGLSGNTVAERFEAFTTVMSSVASERERMAGLTQEQRFAEFTASENDATDLAEVRSAHDALNLLTLQVDTSTVLPENLTEILLSDADELRFNSWMASQRAEDPERTLRLDGPQARAEYAASLQGPDQLAEARATSDRAWQESRQATAAAQERRSLMTDDEKRQEFAANTPQELEKVRAEIDVAIAGRQAESQFNKWMDGQRTEDPERTLRLDGPQARAEYAASLQGADQLAEARAQSDQAWREIRQSTAAAQERRSLMTDDEKRQEFAATTPQELEKVKAEIDVAIAGRQAESQFNKWMDGQRTEDPERTIRLDGPQARAEYAASLQGPDQLAEARTTSDRAWQESRQAMAAAQERRSLMTDDEKRQEFAANTPQELEKVKAEIDAAIAERQAKAPKADEPQSNLQGHDRLSNTDQQKFEAWQGVMGSLDSEKPRMAVLTVDQRRAEYEASQIGPERFQQVRAEHDLVNGYGAAKPAPPEKGSLAHWANELTEAANKNRRPLSGSEFKQVVSSIESCSRGADMEKAKAREVAGLLAKVHGPSGESLFRDPELRNAYKSAIAPDRNKSQAAAPATQAPAEQVTEKNNRTATPMRMR
jgi:hypothetical protein